MADESGNGERMILQVIGVAVTAIAAIGTIWSMRRRRAATEATTADDAEISKRTRSSSGSGQGRVLASRIKANGGQWPPKRSRSRNSSTSGLSVGNGKITGGTKKFSSSPRTAVGRSVKSLAGAFDQKTEDANSIPSAQRKSITLKAVRAPARRRKISNAKSPKYNSATLPPNTKASSTKPATADPVRKAKVPTVKRSSVTRSTNVRPVANTSRVSSTPSRNSSATAAPVRKAKVPTVKRSSVTRSTNVRSVANTSRVSSTPSRNSSATTSTVREAKIPSMKRPTASTTTARPVAGTSSRTDTRTASSRARPSITRKAKVPSQISSKNSENSTGTLRKKRTAVGSSTRTVKPSSPDSKKSKKSSMGCSSSKSTVGSSTTSAPARKFNRGLKLSRPSTDAKTPDSSVNSFATDVPTSNGSTSRGINLRKPAAHNNTKTPANSTNPDMMKQSDPTSNAPVRPANGVNTSTGSPRRPMLKRALTKSIRCHLCLARISDVNDKSMACSFEDNWFHADCFKCQRCGVSLSSDTCELFELIGPLCTEHAKALKKSKRKLRNAVRAISAFKRPLLTTTATASSKPTPTPLVIKGDTVEEYAIEEVDADADDDFNSLFDDIMATHIEEDDESGDDAAANKHLQERPPTGSSRTPDILATPHKRFASKPLHVRTKSELTFTPRRRRQITEESEKFFSEEMFCKTSPKTKGGSTKLRCFRCSDHRKERVSVETSQRLISLGYPSNVGFCSDGDCFACLKCSESLHTVLKQRGMKGISVSPFGAVCTSCVSFSMEAGET